MVGQPTMRFGLPLSRDRVRTCEEEARWLRKRYEG